MTRSRNENKESKISCKLLFLSTILGSVSCNNAHYPLPNILIVVTVNPGKQRCLPILTERDQSKLSNYSIHLLIGEYAERNKKKRI